MISLKNSGDTIAGEFSKLISNSNPVIKNAELNPESSDQVAQEEDDAKDNDAINAEDFIVEESGSGNDHAADAIDGAIDSLESMASPSGMYIMNGLGKIAASLRSKGEGFAADMVEATAFSINDDLNKEANEKLEALNSLRSLASEFDSDNDVFAGDMVRATIRNIISG